MSTKITKKRLREILSEARKLMNDNGAHWIQGKLFSRKRIGMCYCSVGAIEAVTENEEERRAAFITLLREGVHSKYPNNFYARGEIEDWNDHTSRTWKDVDKAFRKAVRALR